MTDRRAILTASPTPDPDALDDVNEDVILAGRCATDDAGFAVARVCPRVPWEYGDDRSEATCRSVPLAAILSMTSWRRGLPAPTRGLVGLPSRYRAV